MALGLGLGADGKEGAGNQEDFIPSASLTITMKDEIIIVCSKQLVYTNLFCS